MSGEEKRLGCDTWREKLSARLDNHLTEDEGQSLESHLSQCEDCQAYETRLLSVHKTLGRLEGRMTVPTPLAARIRAEALRQRPNQNKKWSLVASLAAVAVLSGSGLFLWTTQSPESRHLPDLCTVLVEDHIRYLTSEGAVEIESTEPAQIEQWFKSRLDFAIQVPRFANSRLLGGRLCFLGGGRAALLFYEQKGTRVSFFAFPKISLGGMKPKGDGTWSGGMHGYHVRAARREGITYALVSDLPDEVLDDMILYQANQS